MGDAAHGFEIDTLVEPVDSLGTRAIDERWGVGVEAEEAGIGRGGDRFMLEGLPTTRLWARSSAASAARAAALWSSLKE